MPNKIERIYAWIIVDSADGNEGIPTVSKGLMAFPMIGADTARIESLRRHAVAAAKSLGTTVKLVEFSNMVVLETIDPKKEGS